MKQNAQWLSQVRMRSKTAEETSTPSGSPASLSTRTTRGRGAPARRTRTLRSLGVAESLEIDDVARLVPVEAEELVAHGQTGPGCRRRLGDRSHRGS